MLTVWSSLSVAPDIKTSAIYYFVTAIVILLIAFDTYFILPLTVRSIYSSLELTCWSKEGFSLKVINYYSSLFITVLKLQLTILITWEFKLFLFPCCHFACTCKCMCIHPHMQAYEHFHIYIQISATYTWPIQSALFFFIMAGELSISIEKWHWDG